MLLRSLLVWLLIIAGETLSGTIRQLIIAPALGPGGDATARRIGAMVGTALIYTITWLCIRWMCRPSRSPITTRALLLTGTLWAALTFAFELIIGRLTIASQSPSGPWPAVWSRIAQDYNPAAGGLMAFGLLAMAFCPLACKLRLRRDGSPA